GGEEVEELADFAPGCLVGSLLGLSHQMLELGEELLDGIEVGAVGRQEEEVSAAFPDRLARRFALMRAEIVENDDVARFEGRSEHVLDIGGKELAVDRPVDDKGRLDAVVPERGDEGQ